MRLLQRVRTARGPLLVVLLIVSAVAACGRGGGSQLSSPTPEPTPTSPPIQAEGKIAFITPEGNMALMNPDGSDKVDITSGGGVQDFRWSPDGRLLAVEASKDGETSVKVMTPEGEEVFEVQDAASPRLGGGPLWSPDGRLLAVSQGDGVTVLTRDGEVVRSVASAVRAEWSPDGSELAVVRLDGAGLGAPIVVTLESGEERALDPDLEPHEPVFPIAWHPAGNIIAYREKLYEPETGEQRDLPGVAVDWSPDGRMLLVVLGPDPSERGRPARLLDMTQGAVPVIGFVVRPALDDTPPWLFVGRWIDWSNDSRFLFYLDPDPFELQLRIYDTVEIRQRRLRNIKGEFPDFSPDDSHVAFAADGKIWVFKFDGRAFKDVAEGSLPRWQPQSAE